MGVFAAPLRHTPPRRRAGERIGKTPRSRSPEGPAFPFGHSVVSCSGVIRKGRERVLFWFVLRAREEATNNFSLARWSPVGRTGHGKVFSMSKNIYVGNLVWDATADDLLGLFGKYGTVAQAQVITDRETGRSRGFGFVVMDNDEEAQRAIDGLNNQPFRGRALTVNEARPREDRGGGGDGGGGG